LLALVAAIVISAEAFLRDPVRLVVALVLVVLAVMAGWTALVRRGTWRLVAGGVALVALVAVVVLIAAGSLVRTVVLIGLVLMSTATARVALGHDLAEVPADLRPVERARHGVLVMNPRSGGGKAERLGLEAEARRRGITPVVLHPGDDLRALAERAVNEGTDVLGMAGGDGSQALVADVARTHDVALVVVPAGTRNHFALDLGLDRADVVGALDAFDAALERRIDLGLSAIGCSSTTPRSGCTRPSYSPRAIATRSSPRPPTGRRTYSALGGSGLTCASAGRTDIRQGQRTSCSCRTAHTGWPDSTGRELGLGSTRASSVSSP
jgi:hypothetical protein